MEKKNPMMQKDGGKVTTARYRNLQGGIRDRFRAMDRNRKRIIYGMIILGLINLTILSISLILFLRILGKTGSE
jgi:hypothetical protein